MTVNKLPEVWMRGLIPGIPALLQPVVHALLQAREELKEIMADFPAELMWHKPAGVASVAFHLQHMCGVVNRLFTYAKGEMLNQQQLDALNAEGKEDATLQVDTLLKKFDAQIDDAIEQLKHTDETTLTHVRGIGRKQIPSTVSGLLFHAAEHTMRHLGQLIVTVKIVKQR